MTDVAVTQAAFLAALAEHGIPPDVQELLVNGDGRGTVAPGALEKALSALQPRPASSDLREHPAKVSFPHTQSAGEAIPPRRFHFAHLGSVYCAHALVKMTGLNSAPPPSLGARKRQIPPIIDHRPTYPRPGPRQPLAP